VFHPHELSFDSFLFTNGKEYVVATLLAVIEYFVELLFFPTSKQNVFFIAIGTLGCAVMQMVRTASMWTCGSNFHHIIQEGKDPNHTIVDTGIYA
ncbi:MAG: hypothetical protein CUN54_09945, partial [Phototrophicales bacterium]